ncbi:MAG TPA: hypothetical protein VFC42_01030 [Methylomirabilota bacterium]|nr:hypothetical protein [Methylomirabilota bacterium]
MSRSFRHFVAPVAGAVGGCAGWLTVSRSFRRLVAPVALGVLAVLPGAPPLGAAPVAVRFREGTTRGFLVVRAASGEVIGRGDLGQKPVGEQIASRLVLTFDDGSVRDEATTYSQRGVFRLEAYRLVQRGPSLPAAEVAFDRQSGRYQSRLRERPDAREETAEGALEMPDDLYNGMAAVLLKNLPAGEPATVRLAAFTPAARILAMHVRAEGEDRPLLAGRPLVTTRYLLKLEIGGLAGLVAPIVGKAPPDLRYWLVPGDPPGFVRFEGAMYLNGPVWRVEMAGPQWPAASR